MNLRCKKGDLAVQIKSLAGNAGAIVTVLEFVGEDPQYNGHVWNKGQGPCWIVRFAYPARTTTDVEPTLEGPVPDAWLQPIRGNPEAVERGLRELIGAEN